MAGLFDEWDEKRERAARPAAPQTAQPVDPGRATAYALAALNGEVANILSVPIGAGRNDQLNKSALKMFGLAEAGAISHDLVEQELGRADGGLDYPATRKTLASAREAAARYGARAIPEPTAPAREVPPWEQSSDDPFADNYAPPLSGSPNGSTTTSPVGSAATSGQGSASTPAGPGSASAAAATGTNPPSTHAETGTTSGPSPSSATSGSDPFGSSSAAVAPAAIGASSTADPAGDPDAQLVEHEARQQRIRRAARRIVDLEEAERTFTPPPYLATLADELELPDEPVTYAVAELIPTGANVLLTAQYKTGKTTLVNNLARAIVDGEPFLGRYDVAAIDGRVAIFNYEVDGRQYRRWLRDAGIVNPDRVAVLNLRGYRLPLLVPHVEDWVVEYLKRAEAHVWIVDPYARAIVGSVESENDNTEAGAFLDTLDVIKERAGVSELILPTHTGRAHHEAGDERARGATRLDDWADVRWLLTKDKPGKRYFRATGRDVETDEYQLGYDDETRTLTITGGSRATSERDVVEKAVLTVVRDFPGCGVTELRNRVAAILDGIQGTKVDDAANRLIAAGAIHRISKAGSKLKEHHAGRDPGTVFPDDPAITPDAFD